MKSSEKRKKVLEFCRKASENKDTFEFVDRRKLKRIYEGIRKMDKKTIETYAAAKNYYVGF